MRGEKEGRGGERRGREDKWSGEGGVSEEGESEGRG